MCICSFPGCAKPGTTTVRYRQKTNHEGLPFGLGVSPEWEELLCDEHAAVQLTRYIPNVAVACHFRKLENC